MTENESIPLLKEGNHTAFTYLYNKYWKQVYNFSRLYVSADYAEEVMQEVFIKLWINRRSISETGNLKGYLFIITRNLIFDGFRQQMNEDYRTISLLAACEQACDDMEDEIVANDLKTYINNLIEELPFQCKQVFNLSRKENLTNQEIAEQLGISVKAVEASITRAIKYLRSNICILFLFLSFFS